MRDPRGNLSGKKWNVYQTIDLRGRGEQAVDCPSLNEKPDQIQAQVHGDERLDELSSDNISPDRDNN